MNSKDSPAYLRLRGEIVGAILDGRFSDGDSLPSVRSLAAEHGLNPLTVAKAYQTFQDDGLVTVRRGIGMFVAEGASDRLRRSERETFLTEHWPSIARRIRALGLDVEDLLQAVP
ncbi:GntR family transcriptional regulator [Sphingomonas sp. ID0503]|uniref:GntR family transcriptional regulator n=1 Tax=Sphingomonas sp. ID0503 TaxID=3399691 RepID=UPI003AFA6906